MATGAEHGSGSAGASGGSPFGGVKRVLGRAGGELVGPGWRRGLVVGRTGLRALVRGRIGGIVGGTGTGPSIGRGTSGAVQGVGADASKQAARGDSRAARRVGRRRKRHGTEGTAVSVAGVVTIATLRNANGFKMGSKGSRLRARAANRVVLSRRVARGLLGGLVLVQNNLWPAELDSWPEGLRLGGPPKNMICSYSDELS